MNVFYKYIRIIFVRFSKCHVRDLIKKGNIVRFIIIIINSLDTIPFAFRIVKAEHTQSLFEISPLTV